MQWVSSEPTSFLEDSFSLKKPDSGGHGGPPTSSPVEVIASDAIGSPNSFKRGLSVDRDGCDTVGLADVEVQLPLPKGPHDMPYNPYMTTGALVLSALIGRGHGSKDVKMFHDSGSRFTHLVDSVSAMAGDSKIGFNNPVFLALKQRGLKTLALSHFIKGIGCYPPKTQPTDNAQLYFQACAMEMTPDQLAVVASTIANIGVCPTTKRECLSPSTVKDILSRLYSCGMKTVRRCVAGPLFLPVPPADDGLHVCACVCWLHSTRASGRSMWAFPPPTAPRVCSWSVPLLAACVCCACRDRQTHALCALCSSLRACGGRWLSPTSWAW